MICEPPGQEWLRDGNKKQEIYSSLGASATGGFGPVVSVGVGWVVCGIIVASIGH